MADYAADLLHDPARIAAVLATGVAGTPAEETFDRLTRLARQALGAPISLLSLLDGERQWVKSAAGLNGAVRDVPLDHSICRQCVSNRMPLVVADAEREADEGVRGAMRRWGVRAYLGVPLVMADGHVVGALCVADPAPHEWPEGAADLLRDLGALAVAELERRRAACGSEQTAAAAHAASETLRGIVEQSLAGVYVSQDGFFRYVNRRFCEIFGYPPEYFETPRPMIDLVTPEDRALVEENIRRRISGEVRSVRYAFRGRRADGSVVHLEVHGSRADLGGRPALVGLVIDVTERVRAEREREQALSARDRFYAMISHELRTPVSAVMLYNDLLTSGVYDPLTELQREAVDRSQASARHLLELINDLLDLSRLEAGRLEVRVEELELAELTESVVAGMRPVAMEHGCELALELAARPLPVRGDARRIRQILLNLLSNAVKFGGRRPVTVRCGPAEGGVEVRVTDHGPGIHVSDMDRIFEDFVQLGEPGVGTGLGLPIARRLAELQGGTLQVDSEPGHGSTFRLFLSTTPPTHAAHTLPFLRSSSILG